MVPGLRRLLAVAAVCALSACRHSSQGDGGLTGSIQIESPDSGAWVHGTLQVTVVTEGEVPESIQLLVPDLDGGTPLVATTLPATFTLDTDLLTEGSHTLTAQAWKGSVNWLSNPPTVIHVDRTPPQVVQFMPSEGTQNWALRDPAEVLFSEAMDPASFADGGLTLNATTVDGGVAADIQLTPDQQTAQITPATNFTLPANLSVALAPTVTDLAGNALVNPLAVSGWFWTSPRWLSLRSPGSVQGADGYGLGVCNGAGATYWLLEGRGGVTPARLGGGTWTNLTADVLPNTSGASLEGATSDVNDNLWVITSGTGGHQLARWDTSGWSYPALPVVLTDQGTLNVGMATNSRADLAISFGGPGLVRAQVQILSGGQWTALPAVPQEDANQNMRHIGGLDPQIAFDSDDHPIAAGGIGFGFWSYRYTDAAGWQALAPLNYDGTVTNVTLAAALGQVYALWNAGSDDTFFVAQLTGDHWNVLGNGPVATLSSTSSYPQSLIVTSRGPIVGLQGTADTSPAVFLMRYQAGQWVSLQNTVTAASDLIFTDDRQGNLIQLGSGSLGSALYNE